MTTPYTPRIPLQTPRHLYNSVAQVIRLEATLLDDGTMAMNWQPVTDIVDVFLDTPGMLACRLDVGVVRPGKDQPPPLVAGRPPDRVAVCYYDCATDESGLPLVRSADRLELVSGPVFGTWEIRAAPDVAQDYLGAHHVEVQIIEVAQALSPSSPRAFPGSPA